MIAAAKSHAPFHTKSGQQRWRIGSGLDSTPEQDRKVENGF